MKNEIVAELLKSSPYALQDLHNTLGFDFCAPYHVCHIKGRFTVNSILKKVNELGHTPFSAEVAICIKAKPFDHCYNLVEIVRAGSVKTDVHIPYCYGRKYGTHGLNTFYAKKCFEERRKDENADTFVFVQDKTFLSFPEKYVPSNSDRYHIVHSQETTCRGEVIGIYRVDLQQMDFSKHRVSIGCSFFGEFKTVFDIADKSGYLLADRRRYLRHRAYELKLAREKSEFMNFDTSKQIDELQNLIDTKKKQLEKAFEQADGFTDIKDFSRCVSRFADTVYKFEQLITNCNEKTYRNIKAFKDAYNEISSRLSDL